MNRCTSTRTLLAALLALGAAACEDSNPSFGRGHDGGGVDAALDGAATDGARPGNDGGRRDRGVVDPDDGVPPPDRGVIDPDDGVPPPDRGVIDPDDGVPPPDQGVIDPDDGVPPPDRGVVDPDDGVPPPDQGVVDPDAGECRRDCDGDGFSEADGDCDDADPDIFPGAVEICDGVDNDCDGVIDQLLVECYDGDPATIGVGRCNPGGRTCVDGAFGDCVGQVLPADEICGNRQDDDCDGAVDEGCDGDGDGFTEADGDCDDGDPTIHPNAAELCDGVDNDCDGVIDGLLRDCYEGPAGTAGVGACRGGVSICEGGVFSPECDGQVLPVQEVCGNGEDDDCDGEVDEGCAGAACPDVDLDSPVYVTIDCLTHGASPAGIVVADVRDRQGNPVNGVEITAQPAAAVAPVQERLEDGRVFRVVRTVANVAEARFNASVACDDGQRLALRQQPVVRYRQAPAVGTSLVTGGCDLQGNLQVTIVDAATGVPIDGAWAMVGERPDNIFQEGASAALQGRPGRTANFRQTAANGIARFRDLADRLLGPQTLTVGAEGYENVTLASLDAAAVVVPLRPVLPPPPETARLNGRLSEFDNLARDGMADAGLVVGSFDLPFLATLALPRLLSRYDCWDPIREGVAGGFIGEVPVPGNLYVPRQAENVFGLPVVIEEHRFTLHGVPRGTDHLVALSGKVPTDQVVQMLGGGGGSLTDLLAALDLQEIGVLRDLAIGADRNDLTVPLAHALRENARCDARDLPARASLVCVAAGDWSGANGTGRLFPMGLASANADAVDDARPDAVSLPLTTVGNAAGVFRGIGYLGVGVALYGSNQAPQGQENAVTAVLDRGTLNAQGGVMRLGGFFDTTAIARENLTFSWDPVDTPQSPSPDVCRVDVVRTIQVSYDPGACSPNLLETREVPVWSGYVAGDPGRLALPELPAAWPRAAQSGLVDPAATPERDLLTMRVSCLGLGLAPGFDYNAADFRALVEGLTHVTANHRPF